MSAPAEPDPGVVYETTRQAFVHMAREAPSLAVVVPATPAWTVHDVLAHVVGLATDLNALRFPADDDAGGDAWNAAQVAARRSASLDELAAEWDLEAPVFEDGLRAFGYEFGSHFVGDLVTHFHDVREALGLPASPDPTMVRIALDHYLGHVNEQLSPRANGAVRFVTEFGDRTVGAGPLTATLHTDAFTLLRALSARRSLAAVRTLDWSGDADGALTLVVSAFDGGYTFPP